MLTNLYRIIQYVLNVFLHVHSVFEGSQNWNSPDTSVNVTDATDLDDDDNGHRTWKRVSIHNTESN